ncbi:hypothetical protein OH77DRAFT_680892 [Trametes cingulata]|nr:hypothetical protein OH77DRAFT_680892 [Trametes cingulata]
MAPDASSMSYGSSAGFPLLPTEVIDLIRSTLSPADLHTLVLVNKAHNMVLTPHLYADIKLLHYPSALQCIMLLDGPSEDNAFGRNLVTLVQSFSLGEDTSYPEDANYKLLASTLVLDVLRMANLKHFSCTLALPYSISLLAALLSGAVPKLQSLQLTVSDIDIPPGCDIAHLSLRVPRLRSVKLDIRDRIPPAVITLIREVLTSRAEALRTLSLFSDDEHYGPPTVYLPTAAVFSSLEELAISGRALSHPSLRPAPVRTLVVREANSANEPFSMDNNVLRLDPGAFPRLQRLFCYPRMLQAFLPEQTRYRRPIDTIGLNYVSASGSVHEDGCFGTPESHLYIPSPWRSQLQRLRFSRVGVRRLFLHVYHFPSLYGFPNPGETANCLSTLESLVVVLSDDPGIDAETYLLKLGSEVIAHIPHLHTFVLSDEPTSKEAQRHPFEHAEDLDLQRRALAQYEVWRPTLETVAFTADFHWKKTADGWLQCLGKPLNDA